MLTIILSLFSSARQAFQTRAALQAEILALQQQLLVLQRPSRGHRLRLSRADRFLWVWSGWRSALLIVKPETVIAWHRKGFRLYWKWKSRHPQGRPSVSVEIIDLIRRMSLANPGWGAPRIHGELLKLGFELSQATVANCDRNAFLMNVHAASIVGKTFGSSRSTKLTNSSRNALSPDCFSEAFAAARNCAECAWQNSSFGPCRIRPREDLRDGRPLDDDRAWKPLQTDEAGRALFFLVEVIPCRVLLVPPDLRL
jgi:hypothetical protein